MGQVADQLSFRDPDGYVVGSDGRIFRIALAHAKENLRAFLASDFAQNAMGAGVIVPSHILSAHQAASVLSDLPDGSLAIEHQAIWFPNYPYEWAPAMLHAAAALTLSLAKSAVDAGYGLKDATPYNVMFTGPNPVFIDVLSFQPDDLLDPVWRPWAQFVRTFVYPLLANLHFGVRLDELMLVNRDGLDPERLLDLCSLPQRFLPPFLGCVTLPSLFSSREERSDSYRPRRARDAGEAAFLRKRALQRGERLLRRAEPRPAVNSATRYSQSEHNYTPEEMAAKQVIVSRFLEETRPRSVLDIGCNTGHFSHLAAGLHCRVVAIDRDPHVIDHLWRSARHQHLDILPLVVDIARPPASSGWANAEFASFLDRAAGKFDCVLMLALVHHLLVSERVPLERICELLAKLTNDTAVIEYIDPADHQLERIARGRLALHQGLTQAAFEAAVQRHFRIVNVGATSPHRVIYCLRKRSG